MYQIDPGGPGQANLADDLHPHVQGSICILPPVQNFKIDFSHVHEWKDSWLILKISQGIKFVNQAFRNTPKSMKKYFLKPFFTIGLK